MDAGDVAETGKRLPTFVLFNKKVANCNDPDS